MFRCERGFNISQWIMRGNNKLTIQGHKDSRSSMLSVMSADKEMTFGSMSLAQTFPVASQ